MFLSILFGLISGACWWVLSSAYKVLVIVPGFNYHTHRTRILITSLKNIESSSIDFRCMIFNYNDQVSHVDSDGNKVSHEYLLKTCQVFDYYYANYAHYLKAVPPLLIEEAKFTHVLVLLDDVELKPSFQLQLALDIMTKNNLSVASPAIGILITFCLI